MMSRAVLSLGVVFLLAGCAAKPITEDTLLGENEGILITRIHTNAEYLRLIIHEKDKYKVLTHLIYRPSESLKVVPIRSAVAYIGRIADMVPKIRSFRIVPGTMTYIGDLDIQWYQYGMSGHGQIRVIDNEEETLGLVRNQYPWLFERFAYRKDIEPPEFETIDDFEEPEELRKLREKTNDPPDKEN